MDRAKGFKMGESLSGGFLTVGIRIYWGSNMGTVIIGNFHAGSGMLVCTN